MGLGLLSRVEIIRQGLLLGGNPGLNGVPTGYTEAPAVTFFRTFYHHVCLTRDFGWMVKEAAVTTGTNGTKYEIDLSTVTRYRATKALKLFGVGDVLDFEQEYTVIKADILRSLDVTPAPTAQPYKFGIKPDKTAIVLYPIPDKVYTGTLFYYQMPDFAAIVDGTIIEFEDSQTLINAIAMWVRDYDKDSMINASEAIAQKLFGEYRASQEEINRVKPTVPRLDPFRFQYKKGD